MAQQVHQVDCEACAFVLTSESEDEMIELVQTHAERSHDMSLSEEEVRGMMTAV